MSATLWKRPGVLLGAATVYVGSTAFAYLSFYEPKRDDASLEEISDARRMEVFNANASKYDKDVDFDEMLTGISLMRRFLLRSAKGKVLEIAAGTGRNLPYYTSDAQLTLTDLSDGMLQQIPTKAKKQGLLTECELRVMSASDLQFADDAFDTVVDTFGLCSMDDSVKALEEMQRVCKSDGVGKILLLEHGRSHYAWLSNVLDKFAAKHAQRWGCHWNKDILALVEQAGLEVETVHRFHFGTTYYIVAKPKGTSSSNSTKVSTVAESG